MNNLTDIIKNNTTIVITYDINMNIVQVKSCQIQNQVSDQVLKQVLDQFLTRIPSLVMQEIRSTMAERSIL